MIDIKASELKERIDLTASGLVLLAYGFIYTGHQHQLQQATLALLLLRLGELAKPSIDRIVRYLACPVSCAVAILVDVLALSGTGRLFVAAMFPNVALMAVAGQLFLPVLVVSLEVIIGAAMWIEAERARVLGPSTRLRILQMACVGLALTMPLCAVGAVLATYGSLGVTGISVVPLTHLIALPVISLVTHLGVIYFSQYALDGAGWIWGVFAIHRVEGRLERIEEDMIDQAKGINGTVRGLKGFMGLFVAARSASEVAAIEFDDRTRRVVNGVYGRTMIDERGQIVGYTESHPNKAEG